MPKNIRTISLLGIEGSGKSTISKLLKLYLEKKGYSVNLVPFHYWLFSHKLKNRFGSKIDKGRRSMNIPYRQKNRLSVSSMVKPIIAFIDNIFFYINNFPRKNKEIVIFDRFICATQIKLGALNYNNSWFERLWLSFRTDFILVLDISIDMSIERQMKRGDSYYYKTKESLYEREKYLKYANYHNAIIINTEFSNPETILEEITKQIKI